MARRGKSGPGEGVDGGLHGMPSGLYHTADSQADGPRGTFVDRFGPPGDPTKKTRPDGKGQGIGIGKSPRLLERFQSKSGQKTNTSR